MFKPKTMKGEDNSGLIFCHGGGGVMCNPLTWRRFFQDLSIKLNVVLVVPAYRLAPEHKLPAGYIDIRGVVNHMYANSVRYGIDENKICLAGISGGANMALGAINLMINAQIEELEEG